MSKQDDFELANFMNTIGVECEKSQFPRLAEYFYELSLAYFERMQSHSIPGAIYFNIGNNFMNRHQYEKAVPFLEKGIQREPQVIDAYYTLALANAASGNHEAAIRLFTKAIDMGVSNPVDAMFSIGLCYLEMADYDRAISEFKRVLQSTPNDTTALANIALAYLRNNDLAKAKDSFQKISLIDPSNTIAGLLQKATEMKST